eukprot:2282644-Rhodomonas_salina.1
MVCYPTTDIEWSNTGHRYCNLTAFKLTRSAFVRSQTQVMAAAANAPPNITAVTDIVIAEKTASSFVIEWTLQDPGPRP